MVCLFLLMKPQKILSALLIFAFITTTLMGTVPFGDSPHELAPSSRFERAEASSEQQEYVRQAVMSGKFDPSFFTEANLRIVLGMMRDADRYVRDRARLAIPHFLQANKQAFTQDNIKLVRGMLRYRAWYVRAIAFLIIIPRFIRDNLIEEYESRRDNALFAMGYFIQANPDFAIQANLNLVLRMLKAKDPFIRERALSTIGYFIQANKDLATETNLNLVLYMLKDEISFPRMSVISIIPDFLQANRGAFTEVNLNLVLRMLKDKYKDDVRVSALKALPYFIQANKAFATETNLTPILDMLKGEDGFVQHYAISAMEYFIQANPNIIPLVRDRVSSLLRGIKENYPAYIRLLTLLSKPVVEMVSTRYPTLGKASVCAIALRRVQYLYLLDIWMEYPKGEPVARQDIDVIAQEYLLLDEAFNSQPTTGGKIHLNIDPKSKEAAAIRELADVLNIYTQPYAWEDKKPCLEFHLKPSTSSKALTDTIRSLVELGVFDPINLTSVDKVASEADDSAPEPIKAISLQPSLKVDGEFWDKDGKLRQGPKFLALLLVASSPYRRTYVKTMADVIATHGLIVESAGVLYDKKGKPIGNVTTTDRADLWSVAQITQDDVEEIQKGEFTNGFTTTYRRYHLIGSALLALYKSEAERTPLEQALAGIAQDFVETAEAELSIHEPVCEALKASWKKGNWPELRELLIEIESCKDRLKAPAENILTHTEIRIAHVLLSLYAAKYLVKDGVLDFEDEETMGKLAVIGRSFGLTEDQMEELLSDEPELEDGEGDAPYRDDKPSPPYSSMQDGTDGWLSPDAFPDLPSADGLPDEGPTSGKLKLMHVLVSASP